MVKVNYSRIEGGEKRNCNLCNFNLCNFNLYTQSISQVVPCLYTAGFNPHDENVWFRDEYRGSVWISVPDAKARHIKDNDLVMVHNDTGQCVLPAYVTSRLTPGVCCMIFGRNYEPSAVKTDLMPDGVDRAGSCNILINDDHFDARRGILFTNSLVEIEKADRALPGIYD